jgi:hypothetical protein
MSQTNYQSDLETVKQLEAEIAHTLTHSDSVTIDKSTIENGYSILDATEGEVAGTLPAKCDAIIEVLRERHGVNAEYAIVEGTVVFLRIQPA